MLLCIHTISEDNLLKIKAALFGLPQQVRFYEFIIREQVLAKFQGLSLLFN